MKKTEKTAMTAALFAAAMNLAPSGTVQSIVSASDGSDSTSVSAAAFDDYADNNYDIAPLYGPPVTEEMTEPVTEDDDYYNPELYPPQPTYGPVPCYGDVDRDGKVDVFDLVALRKLFTEKTPEELTEFYMMGAADVNFDGRVTVADLVSLNKYLIGQIDRVTDVGYDEYEELQVPPTTAVTTVPQVVYGPPILYTTTVDDDDDPIEEIRTEFAGVYGPPSWFTTPVYDEDDDPIEDIRTDMGTVYGPPTWFTTPVDTEKE